MKHLISTTAVLSQLKRRNKCAYDCDLNHLVLFFVLNHSETYNLRNIKKKGHKEDKCVAKRTLAPGKDSAHFVAFVLLPESSSTAIL